MYKVCENNKNKKFHSINLVYREYAKQTSKKKTIQCFMLGLILFFIKNKKFFFAFDVYVLKKIVFYIFCLLNLIYLFVVINVFIFILFADTQSVTM